jgi:ribose transport system permease protein
MSSPGATITFSLSRLRALFQGPIVALAALVLVLGLTTPAFFKVLNFINILNQITVWGLLALGMTLVIITGGIDLSVGSVMALTMMILGWSFKALGLPFGIAILLALAVGALCGLINGLMITRLRLPPFIATLAMMYMSRGVANIITNGKNILGFPIWFSLMPYKKYFHVASLTTVIFLGLALLLGLVMAKLPSGRSLYAVGGNEEVARLAGISITKVLVSTYTVCGLFSGLAGVTLASRMNSSYPQSAFLGYEMYAIAMAVIGGASLKGGKGAIGGTLIGALFIGCVNNGLNLNNVNTHVQSIALGVIVVLAIVIDLTSRSRKRLAHA